MRFTKLKLFLIFFPVFLIPQRYVLAIMSLLAVANAYTMRVCLNLAITQMVRKTDSSEGGSSNIGSEICLDEADRTLAALAAAAAALANQTLAATTTTTESTIVESSLLRAADGEVSRIINYLIERKKERNKKYLNWQLKKIITI